MYAKQRRTTSNTTSALMSFFMRSRVRVLLIIAPVLFTVICIFLATASSAEDMEDARRSLPSVSAVAPVQWGQDIVSETTTTEADGEETTTTEADDEQTTKETTTTEANDEQSTKDTMTSSTMTTLSDAGLIASPINSSEITLDMSQNLTELNKTDEILLPQNITQLNLTEQNSTMQSSVQNFAMEQLSSNNTNSSFDRIKTKVMKKTSKKIKETSKGIKETSKKIKEAAKGVKETAKGVKDRIMSTLNGIPVGAGKNATTRQYNETKKNSTGDFANQEPHKQDGDGNEEEQVVATDKNNDDGMEKDADDVQSAMDNKLESLSDDADKEGDLIMKDNWKTSIDQEEW
uniref:Transmembrane protein n=1 Tax=Plectus sambesii TaxID=2011161 RepID=A0A914XDG7_9BILA